MKESSFKGANDRNASLKWIVNTQENLLKKRFATSTQVRFSLFFLLPLILVDIVQWSIIVIMILRVRKSISALLSFIIKEAIHSTIVADNASNITVFGNWLKKSHFNRGASIVTFIAKQSTLEFFDSNLRDVTFWVIFEHCDTMPTMPLLVIFNLYSNHLMHRC